MRKISLVVALTLSQCATPVAVKIPDLVAVCVKLCDTNGGMEVYRFGMECKGSKCVQDKYEMMRCWCNNGANFHNHPEDK